MVSVLPFTASSGLTSNEGEKNKLFCISLGSSRSSLKVSTMRSPLKLTEESRGVADIRTGGMESLGPPCGGNGLAHPVGTLIQKAFKIIKTKVEAINPFLIRNKLTVFVNN